MIPKEGGSDVRRHIVAPGGLLFATSGCGALSAICLQYEHLIPGVLLGLIATAAFIAGAARTRVFWQ